MDQNKSAWALVEMTARDIALESNILKTANVRIRIMDISWAKPHAASCYT